MQYLFNIDKVKKSLLPFFLSAFCIAVISHLYLSRLSSEPFHTDENYYLYASRYFDYVFRNDKTSESELINHFMYITPPVGLYIHGFANYIAGDMNQKIKPLLSTKITNSMLEQFIWKPFTTALPPSFDYFIPGRKASALFGIGTCFFLLLVIKTAFSLRSALIATLAFAFYSDMLFVSRKVLATAPTLFFIMGSLFFLIKVVQSLENNYKKKSLVFALLSGLCTGLATATKLNGIIGYPVTFLGLVIYLLVTNRFSKKHIVAALANTSIALGSATFIFFAVNPFLYTNTAEKITQILRIRYDVAIWQQKNIGPALYTMPEKIQYVFAGMFSPTFTHRYTDDAKVYAIPYFLGGIILGLVAIFSPSSSKQKTLAKLLVVLWTVLIVAATIWWIPLAWEGYRLLAVIPGFIFFGCGLDFLLALFKHFFLTGKILRVLKQS